MLTALAHLILACSRSRSLIADSITENPKAWTLDKGEYCLVHTSGIQLWICNGFWFVETHLEKSGMSQAEKYVVWHAAKRLVRSLRRKARKLKQKELAEKLNIAAGDN